MTLATVRVVKHTASVTRGARSRVVAEPMAQIRRAWAALVASATCDAGDLERFDQGAAIDPAPWDEATFQRATNAARLDMVMGAGDHELGVVARHGEYAVEDDHDVAKAGRRAKLDRADVGAMDWIRRRGGELVQGLSQRKLAALKRLLAQAAEQGVSTQTLARRITRQGLVGLLERDHVAVDNFYRRLLREGRTRTRAADLADRMTRRLRSVRAERIARTEGIQAWSAGQVYGWQQAQRDGLLSRAARQEWVNGGTNPCPVCTALNGKRVPIGGEWAGGYRYPGQTHPDCECFVVLVIDLSFSGRRRRRAA